MYAKLHNVLNMGTRVYLKYKKGLQINCNSFYLTKGFTHTHI
jgi:hypothetical protein